MVSRPGWAEKIFKRITKLGQLASNQVAKLRHLALRELPMNCLIALRTSVVSPPRNEFANLEDDLSSPSPPPHSRRYSPFTHDSESLPRAEDLNPEQSGCSSIAWDIPNYIANVKSNPKQNRRKRLWDYLASLTGEQRTTEIMVNLYRPDPYPASLGWTNLVNVVLLENITSDGWFWTIFVKREDPVDLNDYNVSLQGTSGSGNHKGEAVT